MKLNFKICGSGYKVFIDAGDTALGIIDKLVDGVYYWIPYHNRFSATPLLSADILREILDMLDKLNRVVECNQSAATLTPERAEKLKAIFDAEELAMNSSLAECSGPKNVCMGKPIDT